MTDSTKLISKLNSKISALTGKIAALQAELGELKANATGCDYCNQGSDMSTAQDIDAWIQDDILIISDLSDAEHINIRFCPMCGRRLEKTI